MRKLIQGFFLTSTLATSLTFAQTTTTTTATPRTPPTPAMMVAHRVTSLANALGLSADQQSKASSIFLANQTANATTHASLRSLQTQLDAAIKSNNTSAINALSQQIGTLHGQLTASEANANAAFYQTLTADQQAKLATMHHGAGLSAMGRMGPGGPGGGPGARFRGPRNGAASTTTAQ